MKSVFRILVVGCTFAALLGCQASNSVQAGPDSPYSYSPDHLLTFAIANQKPAEFTAAMTDSERVRRLFAYPKVATNPMGTFLATHAMASSPYVVDKYLNAEEVTYGQKMPGIDDMLVLGVGIGGVGGAALAGAAIASGTNAGADLRERSSSALCFIDSTVTPDAGEALTQCQDTISGHMKSVLNATQAEAGKVSRAISGSIVVDGVSLKVVLYVIKKNSAYAAGFAPKDIGGYKAHIFKVEFFPQSWTDKPKGHALVEQLAEALAKDKPRNLFYRLSAAHDVRNRGGLEPIGVY